ncbi:DUF5703 family protein [Kocuria palustris]|uniref:DUF5703 family protein n=1 Tax=Kocuria palustris TaxID=71999 RepID=UPI00119C9359|nr:DUF5703 family protein [Kocuria palustris]
MREQVVQSSIRRDPHSEDFMDPRYEYLLLTVAPGERISDARARLMEHAEYGKWELHRVVHLYGGARKHWLRRRVMRVERTL